MQPGVPSLNRTSVTYYPADTGSYMSRMTVGDEQALYPVWQKQQGNVFHTGEGEFQVIFPGEPNPYSGPDFTGCVLKGPGGRFITGDVEIHTDESHWYRHRHAGDPRYRNVILHVVLKRGDTSVAFSQLRKIPTIAIHLPRLPESPCARITELTGDEYLNTWIRVSAEERWEEVKRRFRGDTGALVKGFFKMVSIRGNESRVDRLVDRFLTLTGVRDMSDIEVISRLLEEAETLSWETGRRRPLSHPEKKVPIIAYLCFLFINDRHAFVSLGLRELLRIAKDLKQGGYPVPGRDTLKELLGNIVIPLSDDLRQDNGFDRWFRFRVPHYSVTRRRLRIWGLAGKGITFGHQQGILQIEKTCCMQNGCIRCPLIMDI